jgi:hypothetical protein
LSQRDSKFDGAFEVKLIVLACSPVPEERARWTIRFLAEKAVELDHVVAVSAMAEVKIL